MSRQDQLDKLETELSIEEGLKHFLYDDATGKQFLKGMTLIGNLTIAVGVNLMIGMDDVEVKWISEYRMGKVLDSLAAKFPWYVTLDPVRQDALADIAFNIGIAGISKWTLFLNACAAGDWKEAVRQISTNLLWIAQVHNSRATRIENELLTGVASGV